MLQSYNFFFFLISYYYLYTRDISWLIIKTGPHPKLYVNNVYNCIRDDSMIVHCGHLVKLKK